MSARTQPEIRIGDREREQAVSALGEHYLAGRLAKEEYDDRAAAAWTAKTASQLQPLFWDLPRAQPPAPATAPSRRRPRRRGLAFGGFPLFVAVVVLLAVLGAPWWVWLVLGWMWFSGMLAGFGVSACRSMRHPRH